MAAFEPLGNGMCSAGCIHSEGWGGGYRWEIEMSRSMWRKQKGIKHLQQCLELTIT